MRTYIINTHGMKSALANIKEMELSGVAMKLEAAGREKRFEIIMEETPAFLASLRAFAEKLVPGRGEDDAGGSPAADEDPAFLREKLLTIKAACEEYDEGALEAALSDLKEKAWSQKTNGLLDAIAEHLLHSDFDEIVESIGHFLEQTSA